MHFCGKLLFFLSLPSSGELTRNQINKRGQAVCVTVPVTSRVVWSSNPFDWPEGSGKYLCQMSTLPQTIRVAAHA